MEEDKRWEGKTIELFYTKAGPNWKGYLPDGKIVLVDKKQKNNVELLPGIPYISFIKKEIEGTAFSTIIGEAFLPRVIVLPTKILVILRNENKKVERLECQKMEEVMKILKEKRIDRTFMFIRYVEVP